MWTFKLKHDINTKIWNKNLPQNYDKYCRYKFKKILKNY